jgi:hypothetical protein
LSAICKFKSAINVATPVPAPVLAVDALNCNALVAVVVPLAFVYKIRFAANVGNPPVNNTPF